MSQQPQSPDRPMTRLYVESAPPPNITLSPDGKSWTSPDGKRNGPVIEYGDRKLYLSQRAVEIASDCVRSAHQTVDGEKKAQTAKNSNPAEADAKAANIIATKVETDLKKPRPQDAEIKQAEVGYLADRRTWIKELLTKKQLPPEDLESALATLLSPGGDAIVYHLARIQIQILEARKNLDGHINPDGQLDGAGVNAWQTVQTLAAYRTNMERQFLVPQIERRAAEAKTQREAKERKTAVLVALKNFEFSPDTYRKILKANLDANVITSTDETEALGVLAKRYSDFSPKGLGAKFGQSALDKDREFRKLSENRPLPDGQRRDLFLLREFRTAHGIPNDAQLTPAEVAIIRTKIGLDVQRARLNEYRIHDKVHQREIAKAQAKYEEDFGEKGNEAWNRLKTARQWS